MLKLVDRAFGVLLALGAAGHAAGLLALLPAGSQIQVWSLSGVVAAALVAALNLVRAGRPNDRTIAWLAFAGSLAWCAIALLFGRAIGDLLDFRVVWHFVCALALTAFSLRTALTSGAGAS